LSGIDNTAHNGVVAGSIPARPTSLRSRSEQGLPRRSPKGEGRPLHPRATARQARSVSLHYVYILRSLEHHKHYFVGVTSDLRARLQRHNAGEISHTSKFAPWAIKTYVAFSDEKQAFAFERYLKSPSGRAFAKKRL